MKKLFSLFTIVAFLASMVACEYQKKDPKTDTEIARYSVDCVKSFLKKLYKERRSARDLCFTYTLSGSNTTTLYDAAIQTGVKWNPDEISVQDEVEIVNDDHGVLKYVIVNASYQGKQAKFFVGFDQGLVEQKENVSTTTHPGSEGRTVILESEGFLPDKISEEGKRKNIKIAFQAKNDMINYTLAKGVDDYDNRALVFLKNASLDKIDYGDNEKRGEKIGRCVLADSIKSAKLIAFENKQGLLDVLKTIKSDGTINLYSQPCHLIYTNNIGVYMRRHAYDSEGIVDWTSCWKKLFKGSDWVYSTLVTNIETSTDIELFDMAEKSLKDHMHFEENRRLLMQLQQRNQY